LLVQLGQAVTRVKTLLEITAQLRKGEMPDTQKVIGCSSDLVCGNIGKMNPEVSDYFSTKNCLRNGQTKSNRTKPGLQTCSEFT